MLRRAERLNFMLLKAAEDVIAAVNRGEITFKQPKHSLPLTMLANRVDECHKLEIKEDRNERTSTTSNP